MKYAIGWINRTVEALLRAEDAWKATMFVSPTQVIRATRKLYGRNTARGRHIDKRERNIDIILTLGKPNYVEREFIKDCKRAGEPLPVKKVQLKYPPKARRK